MSLYGVLRMLRSSSEAPSEEASDSFDIQTPTPPQALDPPNRAPVVTRSISTQNVEVQTEAPVPPSSIKVGVLLDGDADHFNRAYTSKGHQGGRLAAIELKNAVERFIRKEKALASQVRIDVIAYSFQNSQGLSKFLSDDIQAFSQGFNRSGFAFSMSDVGAEPQGADTALKAHLPILLETCNYVLFGGSHDNGYHSILADSKAAGLSKKIVLLRTTPYCAETILELGFEEARFHPLFEGRDPTEKSRRPYKPVVSGSSEKEIGQAAAPRVSPSTVRLASEPSLRPCDATYDFMPLLRLLLNRTKPPHPETRPLRGSIAYELGTLSNPPIDISVRGNFKRYIEDAAARGLVKLGVGEVEGTEWIEMAMPFDKARMMLPSNEFQRVGIAVPDQPTPQPIKSQHEVLLQVLHSFPRGESTFSAVSEKMTLRGLRVWQGYGTFADFVNGAIKAGLVAAGRVEGQKHDFWIKSNVLTSHGLATSAAVSTPALHQASPLLTLSHRSDTVPDKFLALVNVFIEQNTHRIDRHRLASHLSSAGRKPYETGRWHDYLEEAKHLGLIKIDHFRSEVLLTLQETRERRR